MALEPAQLPCGKCGKLLDVQLNPKPKMVNLENLSMILLDHSGHVTCPCGATLLPIVMTVGTIGIHLAPVPPPAEKKRIIEPSIGEIGRF